ncbi:MAG: 5'-nucleotidase, lipoprotein e(P4) family [Bacteroidetes bacterium]|nr:5'-nucleotidase, lipoprotein e(P4) family [Bacteroidota bacterium]
MGPKKFFLLVGVGMLAACHEQRPIAAVPAPGVVLTQQSVDAVIYQRASAEVHRLYQQGYELARLRLDRNLDRPHALPPAVIVDIDETVLDNSPYQVTAVKNAHTYDPAEWTAWCRMARAKALPGAVEFLTYAASQGCAVFYITNRSAEEKAATVQNLRSEGFPSVDDAHVLVMEGTSDKTARRAAVSKEHYVALLCGDQLTDFDQSLKDRTVGDGKPRVDAMADTLANYFVLLPNPMYGVWLDGITGRNEAEKAGNKARWITGNAY